MRCGYATKKQWEPIPNNRFGRFFRVGREGTISFTNLQMKGISVNFHGMTTIEIKSLFAPLVFLLVALMPVHLCAAESGFAYSDSFYYRFTEADQKVRFAVTLPYVQRDLEAFLSQHVGNAHLT